MDLRHRHAGELGGAHADLQGKREQGIANSLGLLDYPILQAADIVIYKASRVPVGKDQAAHLELSREVVRAFNRATGRSSPSPSRSSPMRRRCSASTGRRR